jgi:hypothetical protein
MFTFRLARGLSKGVLTVTSGDPILVDILGDGFYKNLFPL